MDYGLRFCKTATFGMVLLYKMKDMLRSYALHHTPVHVVFIYVCLVTL